MEAFLDVLTTDHRSKMHIMAFHVVDTKGTSCRVCHTDYEDTQYSNDLRDNIALE